MEKSLLHYMWKNKLISKEMLKTTKDEQIEIFNTGEETADDLSVFKNAAIAINGKEHNGNIVIIDKNDTTKDRTQTERTILQITSHKHKAKDENIPTLSLKLSERIIKGYNDIITGFCPCTSIIDKMDKIHIDSYFSRLSAERMEDKAARITGLYEESDKKWDETLFRLLARNFGFGIQSDAFEKWAKTLNLTAISKHRDNLLQVEAAFFGQAGLLEEAAIPEYYKKEASETSYFKELQREYRFLTAKFNLRSIEHSVWKNISGSVPHTRIARLAMMFHENKISVSAIAETDTLEELKKLLQTQLEGYWTKHNQFGGTIIANDRSAVISTKHLNLLIINTIVPILYSYGKHRQNHILCNRSEDLLHLLPCEDNGIIRNWAKIGINANCAADTQALIQLKKEYCNKKRCPECRFVYTYLKQYI